MDKLTKQEQLQIELGQALFELEIMGDKFAKENIEIVKNYIAYLESKIERLEGANNE